MGLRKHVLDRSLDSPMRIGSFGVYVPTHCPVSIENIERWSEDEGVPTYKGLCSVQQRLCEYVACCHPLL